MTQLIVPLYAEATGWTVTIDGITYRPPLVDSSGRLLVHVGTFDPGAGVANNHRTVTTAGSAVQLQSQACLSVVVTALPGNTDDIYLGDSAVSSANGKVLPPGLGVALAIDNVNLLFIDAAVDGEGVSWLAVTA